KSLSNVVFGCFLFVARVHRERTQIYITSLIHTCGLILLRFDISQWTIKVRKFQEILYDARFGEIDFVNRAFAVYFCLPAIVVHVVKLCLGANIEQHRHN
ncbi:hypothetical protein H5410_017627, partial [Solanum commersonii]